MTSSVFRIVIEYIYTGRVESLSPELCIEVLVASNMLDLNRLTQLCERGLSELVDEDNVRSELENLLMCR